MLDRILNLWEIKKKGIMTLLGNGQDLNINANQGKFTWVSNGVHRSEEPRVAKVEAGETDEGQLTWERCFLQSFRQGSDMIRALLAQVLKNGPPGSRRATGRQLLNLSSYLPPNKHFFPKAEQKTKGDCVILLLDKPITFREGGACRSNTCWIAVELSNSRWTIKWIYNHGLEL